MSLIWHRRAALNTPYNPWKQTARIHLEGDRVNLYDATHADQLTGLTGAPSALQAAPAKMGIVTPGDADFHGHQSITFDGANTFYGIASVNIPAVFTWYAVVKWGASAVTKSIFDQLANVGYRQTVQTNTTGKSILFAGSASITGLADVRGTVCVIAAVVNGASSALYTNSTTPVATGNPGASTMFDLCVGGYGGVSNMMQGKLAMLGGFDGADSLAVITRKARYFADQYGGVFA